MALMHDYARPQHQASFVKFFVFTLFVCGYFLNPTALGITQNVTTLLFQNEAWCPCSSDVNVH